MTTGRETRHTQKKLDITPLKLFVAKNLPNSSALRSVIASEPDLMDVEDFTSRLAVWLRLIELEFEARTGSPAGSR